MGTKLLMLPILETAVGESRSGTAIRLTREPRF